MLAVPPSLPEVGATSMPHGVHAVGHNAHGVVAGPQTGALPCSIAHNGQFVVCGQSR
jgi:hypothetical protein